MSPLLEEMPDRAGEYIILGKTCSTRPAESLVPRCPPLACKRLCLPFPVPAMLLFWMSLVQAVDVIIMALATQNVSSHRGYALSFLKR